MKSLILLAFAIAAQGAEHWSEIQLAGQPTGYLHSSVELLAGGNTRTTDEILFALNRLGSRVEIRSTTRTVEDAAGMLVSLKSETTSSQQTISFEALRKGSELEIHTNVGDKSYVQILPASGSIYGPEGVSALFKQKVRSVRDAITYQMFVPEIGRVAKFTRTALAEEKLNGETVWKVEEESDAMPDRPLSWYDHDGTLVRSEREMPFGKMVTRAADRDTALAAAKGSELGSESYTRTLARSNVRLPDPRSVERVVLRLTHKRPELGWPAFEGPHQRILSKSASSVTLEVTRPPAPEAVLHTDGREYLKPNAILQSDDEEVTRLAHSIVGDEHEPYKAARKLQTWVADHLSLDLGIALAPASEVVRNRRGTCIAYSVLLASLERAAGIPSRVAEGFVYIDGIWGGHAWTEILIGSQWIPLDAALYRAGPADAARFQFGSYTLEDNLAAANRAGMQMYGNIDVAVIEYTIQGRRFLVADGTAPYRIEGERYQNTWLGISVAKPAGFRFTTLDAAYPDATIVRMENGGAAATIQQWPVGVDPDVSVKRSLEEIAPGAAPLSIKIGGRAATLVGAQTKARLVTRDGDSLWVVTAEGPDSRRLLQQIADGWKWTQPE